MRISSFSGDQIAQVNNPDPFAVPVWRSPVFHTPGWIIAVAQLIRGLWALIRFAARHPIADTAVALGLLAWRVMGWPGPVVLVLILAAALLIWRWRLPGLVLPVGVAPGAGQVAPLALRQALGRGHDHLAAGADVPGPPVAPRPGQGDLDAVTPTGCWSGWCPGQCAADFSPRAENLAHSFGVILCRIRSARPGWVVLELVRRDALAAVIPALPVSAHADLRALPVGRREDGTPWLVKVAGTHVLIAGATGAGKASLLWSIIRALLSPMTAGLVRVLAADPKGMELAYGREIFDRYGAYAADPAAIVTMLEAAVADMQARARQLAGRQRDHTPSIEFPFVIVLVDEVAFLTAYLADKQLRERVKAALSTLTTQGRAVGYCVIAALQDPRKEVMSIRNLFPDRIAMRLDEPEQVDMVLGDGARDRGGLADLISTDPPVGAGVAYVRLESDPDPVRVRAAWVSDDNIREMVTAAVPAEIEPAALPAAGGERAA